MTETIAAPTTDEIEQYRIELTGYCYRMLGSVFEAEDAVQDTMVRAWRHADGFEGRSSLRSWLYRIATNVCLTVIESRKRRVMPVELGGASPFDTPIGEMNWDIPWMEPAPDARVIPSSVDPAEATVLRESIRLAFMCALQRLPARQRAALILCDVLQWKAEEAATLLETTVPSINSTLQRARVTLAETDGESSRAVDPEVAEQYMRSFEAYNMNAIAALLKDDVVLSMPPFEMWVTGIADVTGFMAGQGAACRGSRLFPVQANGVDGFAQFKPDAEGGFSPWALQLFEIGDGKVARIAFLETPRLFPMFGMPLRLDS